MEESFDKVGSSSWNDEGIFVDRASTPPMPDWLIRASHRGYELLSTGYANIPEVSPKTLPAAADPERPAGGRVGRGGATVPAQPTTPASGARHTPLPPRSGQSLEVTGRGRTERPTVPAGPGDPLAGLRQEMASSGVNLPPRGMRPPEPSRAAPPPEPRAAAPPTPRPTLPNPRPAQPREPEPPARQGVFQPKAPAKDEFRVDWGPTVDTRQQWNLIPPPKKGPPAEEKHPEGDVSQGRLGSMFKKFFGE
ncbi:MAG: hypothetical protein SF028_12535 [Candidatus Sumerlaeia bacterium]|nr:hypothetical protein [Candidatus Sumerlaeia bacterium]